MKIFIFIVCFVFLVKGWTPFPPTNLTTSVLGIHFVPTSVSDPTPQLLISQTDGFSSWLIYYQWDISSLQFQSIKTIDYPLRCYQYPTYYIDPLYSPTSTPLLVLGLCKLQIIIIDLWNITFMSLPISPIPDIESTYSFSYTLPPFLLASYLNSTYIWNIISGEQLSFIDSNPLVFSLGDPLLNLGNSLFYLQDNPPEIFQWEDTNFINGNTISIPEYFYAFPSDISDVGVWLKIPDNNILVIGRSTSSNTYCMGSFLFSVEDTQPPVIVLSEACLLDGNYVPFSGILVNSSTAVILVENGDMDIIVAVLDPLTLAFSYGEIQWNGYYIFPENLVDVPGTASDLFPFDFILNFQASDMSDGSEIDVLMPFKLN